MLSVHRCSFDFWALDQIQMTVLIVFVDGRVEILLPHMQQLIRAKPHLIHVPKLLWQVLRQNIQTLPPQPLREVFSIGLDVKTLDFEPRTHAKLMLVLEMSLKITRPIELSIASLHRTR